MGNGTSVSILARLLATGCKIPAGLSRGELALLDRLVREEDENTGEQLTRFAPGGWWIGSDNLSAQTCFRLIRHCLISKDGNESGGVSYWRVNEMGRMVLSGMSLPAVYSDVS